MKKILKILTLSLSGWLLFTPILLGQTKDEVDLLMTPGQWRKEIINFPLSFAPQLDYVGVEDIRFSDGWSKKESAEFWTYTFVWHLDEDPMLSATKLETDMQVYFDGLVQLVAKGKKIDPAKVENTVALFLNSEKDLNSNFTGKISFFDPFFTESKMILNVKVNSLYCNHNKKYSVLFRLSPKKFDSQTWALLDKVRRKETCQ